MTQAYNLSQLANKVNSSGQLDVATGVTGTAAVANGGTGQTTYTNGQLLIGNTTGNTLTKATLTAGTGITITNGTGSVTIAASSGQLQYNIYTSGATTWTAPAGVTRIKVICIGGGGGGGSSAGPGCCCYSNGGGGGAGGISIGIYTVVPGTGYVATVGAGGVGNNAYSTSGTAGATSSLGSLLSATGGGGGLTAYSGGADGANGTGTSGITANSSIGYGAGGNFVGANGRGNGVGSTAAVAWTVALNLVPGARGEGATVGNSNASGGIGGVVYIEYIG